MFSCVGLNFDRVFSRADLTNVVVITIVGVSPVVQPYTTVMSPYTFGMVGVAPVCLPYTSVVGGTQELKNTSTNIITI